VSQGRPKQGIQRSGRCRRLYRCGRAGPAHGGPSRGQNPIIPPVRVPSVSTMPGFSALTRIFLGPSSRASTEVTVPTSLQPDTVARLMATFRNGDRRRSAASPSRETGRTATASFRHTDDDLPSIFPAALQAFFAKRRGLPADNRAIPNAARTDTKSVGPRPPPKPYSRGPKPTDRKP